MPRPQISRVLSFSIFAMTLSLGAQANSVPRIDVPIRRVFFPSTGYGSGEDIQIVVEGELLDPCYVLDPPRAVLLADGRIAPHLQAWRDQAGACDTGDLLGGSPFSEQISLGTLPPGDYQVAFNPDDSSIEYRKLHVETLRANALGRDVRVTALRVPDITLEGQAVRVTLSGTLSSACHHLDEPVASSRQGDTIVIHPVETRRSQCDAVLQAFEKTINLGVLPPGEYLVHVPSQTGHAVEKTLTVIRTHAVTQSRRDA